jgi:hypothetical protein
MENSITLVSHALVSCYSSSLTIIVRRATPRPLSIPSPPPIRPFPPTDGTSPPAHSKDGHHHDNWYPESLVFGLWTVVWYDLLIETMLRADVDRITP